MLRILICDDDQAQLNYLRDRIRTLCDQNSTAAIIHSFDDAGSIPQQLLRDHDIAFLDIDFREKGYNGIHIAKELRQANQDSVIIFVTNYIEYAPEGYEVQAFRYLLKSETDSKLERYLLDAVTKSQEQQEKITFTISGEPITIALRDILYIEAQAHNAVIHICAKKDSSSDHLRIYSSLKKLETQLSSKGFLRIQKSFLANMRRMKRFQSTGAELDNGIVLPVSPKTYAQRKAQYLLWKGGH